MLQMPKRADVMIIGIPINRGSVSLPPVRYIRQRIPVINKKPIDRIFVTKTMGLRKVKRKRNNICLNGPPLRFWGRTDCTSFKVLLLLEMKCFLPQ